MALRRGEVELLNARIGYLNFSGRKDAYNPGGRRTFSVFFNAEEDQQILEKLTKDGWKVKVKDPNEEGEPPTIHLPVTVAYGNWPPQVFTVTERGKTPLDESTIGQLDFADISRVDLILSPYNWTYGKDTGIRAYLKKMYVVLEESDIDKLYGHVPMADTSGQIPFDTDLEDEEI